MKIVVFGLAFSSSWGNGHATLWRALARGLHDEGHRLVFFERDVPYYAFHRDCQQVPGGELHLYSSWEKVRVEVERALHGAAAAIVTSYCPDAAAATEAVLASAVATRAYYDLDSPVTLERLGRGEQVDYIPPRGLSEFDLVLSFAGGAALDGLKERLGARVVEPLYGSVDPDVHKPVPPSRDFEADFSYLGTYSPDRQPALDALFLRVAARLPERRFLLGGSQYPQDFPWRSNVYYVQHVPPALHPAFYCSAPLTLNVTRQPMVDVGYCPSGRLFEAAACGAPVLSDRWDGLDEFFTPGREISVARTTEEAAEYVSIGPEALAEVGRAARERALREHTGQVRARQLCELLNRHRRRRGVTSAERHPTRTSSAGRS